jgi:hypothetical protein
LPALTFSIQWPDLPGAKNNTRGETEMSELLAPLGASPEDIDEAADPVQSVDAGEVARTPVLITEQEVLFASAAAVPLQPAKSGRRWTDVIGAGLRAMFASSTAEPRERRHYPPRNDFLESSRMAREMHRL